MTPSLAEMLRGNFMCLAQPPDPEAAGEFMASKVAVIALLNLLAAQELEKAGALEAENAELEAMLGPPGELPADPAERNAHLRRALIRHHEALETRGADDAAVLAIYRRMAERWLLELPPLPASV